MSTAVAAKTGNPVIDYFRDFGVLRDTRLEYWGTQIVNFIDCTMYFAMLTIATVFLSEDLGMSDEKAGLVVTVFTSATTLCLFLAGMVSDWLGIRASLYLTMVALLGLRLVVVWAGLSPELPNRGWIVAGALALMAPFMAMLQTVFQSANKRFTTSRSRSAGFNLWYLFMNIGAFAAGILIDALRLWWKVPNANTHIFTFGVFSAVICLIVALFTIRREDQLYGADEAPATTDGETGRERLTPWESFIRVATEPVFWRFTLLVTLLLGVRAVFAYMYLLFPKYWLRVIGPDAPIGVLNAINPFLIVAGLIVLIPVLNRFSVYSMLVYGAIISALSLFVQAIPSHGQQTIYISIVALVVLSIGELIWSPRLTEYTAAIAPEGQEGVYLGLSMVPWFAAKTVVSAMSGWLLTTWSPEFPAGEPILGERIAAGQIPFWQSPSAMWIILGIPAIGGPLIALFFKGFFTKGAKFENVAGGGH
jgi:MFS family permease